MWPYDGNFAVRPEKFCQLGYSSPSSAKKLQFGCARFIPFVGTAVLIEFTVSNFRSFREPQTLSMAAAPRLQRKENTIKLDSQERLPSLLKVAAIYGPNASGKSALLRALSCIPTLMRRQPETSGRALPVWPFRFDSALAHEPSKFEYHFVRSGMRYQYEAALKVDRVIEERLSYFPKGREQLLYHRVFNKDSSSGYVYVFGDALEGSPEVHDAWARLTGPRSLFLSQAVANSSEEMTQLKEPFHWFTKLRNMSARSTAEWTKSTEELIAEHQLYVPRISSFLSSFDVPIVGMRFQEKPGAPKGDGDAAEASNEVKALYIHQSALGTAEFSLREESDGTQNLIGFWLPWMLATLNNEAEYCSVLVVDEMDSSLHPKIVENLIRSHLEKDCPVQLIFTTHDTHLMNAKLLRRDQFWIVERDENAASQLRSVYDFKGREGEDIEKRYYEGRYRGLPIVKRVRA